MLVISDMYSEWDEELIGWPSGKKAYGVCRRKVFFYVYEVGYSLIKWNRDIFNWE